MQRFQKVFPPKCLSVIGMIHVDALPGTFKINQNITNKIVQK